MKKILLLVMVSVLTLSSCSKDDDNAGSDSIKMTIDGVAKSFNNVTVTQQNEGSDVYLTVMGTVGTSTTDIVTFDLYRGDVGADAVDSFGYNTSGQSYFDDSALTTAVQTNSGGKLKGTFSGTLEGFDSNFNTVTIAVTNGTFNISY